MLRKLLSLAVILIFVSTFSAVGQGQEQALNIGYMNPQEVLSQLPERADIEQQLNSFVQQKGTELNQKRTEFQQAVSTYQQNAASMSQEQQQKREEELSTQEQELMELQQSIQQQIQQRRAELMSPIYNRMDKAIAAVAQSNNLDFVLNESTGYGDTIIYYSANQRLNITQEVLNQMNSSNSN